MASNTPEDINRRSESVSLAIKAAGIITEPVSGDGVLKLAKDIDDFVAGTEAK